MFDPTIGDTGLIAQVREGMQVRDSGGASVGKVKRVQMGGNDPVDGARQAAEAGPINNDPNAQDATLLGDLAATFTEGADDLPAEERQNLERKGFIEIGGGFFTAARYATADQIAGVEGEDVVLNVGADMLAKG